MALPPFASRTTPTELLFEHTTPDGDRLTLRVPAMDDPVSCALPHDETPWGADEQDNRAAFADQTPVWWIEYADCPDDVELASDEGCCCGLLDLADVVELLGRATQRAALEAHLDALSKLRRHLQSLLEAGESHGGFGGFDGVCVACITDPYDHLADLDAAVDSLARDLVDSSVLAGIRLLPEA